MNNYVISKEGITYDIFDGEVVALNLFEGKYYSMEDTASYIWQCFAGGMKTNEIIKSITIIGGAPQNITEQEIIAFIQQLKTEGLLVEVDSDIQASEISVSLEMKGEYKKPELSVFTDMQEVIALDPVHDVSEKGWPNK